MIVHCPRCEEPVEVPDDALPPTIPVRLPEGWQRELWLRSLVGHVCSEQRVAALAIAEFAKAGERRAIDYSGTSKRWEAMVEQESAGTLLARLGTDGRVWAAEFSRVYRELYPGGPELDEGWLLGWFANAIEAGRSAGQEGDARYADAQHPDAIGWRDAGMERPPG
jgi:hypothetical protein